MKEPIFDYDMENGITTCVLPYKNTVFVGQAICCPSDMEYASEITGCEIAHARAAIKNLIHIRDNELKPAYIALKHAHACMKQSKHFNKDSYENNFLRREIRRKEKQLNTINYEIAELKENLKSYINAKDKFYQRLRAQKDKDKNS